MSQGSAPGGAGMFHTETDAWVTSLQPTGRQHLDVLCFLVALPLWDSEMEMSRRAEAGLRGSVCREPQGPLQLHRQDEQRQNSGFYFLGILIAIWGRGLLDLVETW